MATYAQAMILFKILREILTSHKAWWLSDRALWRQELDARSMALHQHLYRSSDQVKRRQYNDGEPGWIVIPGEATLSEDAFGVYNRLLAIVSDWNVVVKEDGTYNLPQSWPLTTLRPQVSVERVSMHEPTQRLDLYT